MILVTGASGFVGRHMVRYLSDHGHTVKALYWKSLPEDEMKNLNGVTWINGDLLDVFAVEEAMEGINEVYHCAGLVSFEQKHRKELLHFNVESTANVVNQALEQDIRKLLFISSVAALGKKEEGKEISEGEPWEEKQYPSVYGLSKHLSEMEVWRGIAEGLNAVIINPSTILGPGNWDQGSARLIKVVDSEFPFYTEGVTGWVDVDDVVKAAYMLMQSDINAERFIVSAGNYSFREVFTKMAVEMGRKPPHFRAGRFLAGLVWRWNAFRSVALGKKVTVTKETAGAALRKTYYNNGKLKTFLPSFGYQPIGQTIAKMAGAYVKSRR